MSHISSFESSLLFSSPHFRSKVLDSIFVGLKLSSLSYWVHDHFVCVWGRGGGLAAQSLRKNLLDTSSVRLLLRVRNLFWSWLRCFLLGCSTKSLRWCRNSLSPRARRREGEWFCLKLEKKIILYFFKISICMESTI